MRNSIVLLDLLVFNFAALEAFDSIVYYVLRVYCKLGHFQSPISSSM